MPLAHVIHQGFTALGVITAVWVVYVGLHMVAFAKYERRREAGEE